MDPNANLKEQLRLVSDINECAERNGHHACSCVEDAERLAELVEALDQWLRSGGFLPEAWRNNART